MKFKVKYKQISPMMPHGHLGGINIVMALAAVLSHCPGLANFHELVTNAQISRLTN